MSRPYRIAVDAMSGDNGPEVVLEAARHALGEAEDGVELILVGDEDALQHAMAEHGTAHSGGLRIHHCSQVVAMDELPSQAMRNKRDSSMRVSIDLVKRGEADVSVSAGNTGALMATARYVLKTLPGIDRPAICTSMPSETNRFNMLDLGANVDCTAEHLFQFALMGSVLAEAVDGVQRPRIGLLNLGEEEIKGNDQVKGAASLLQASELNYVGYVEGDSMYRGEADVVVCDGFTGNVALKASEGVAALISRYMREEFTRNVLTKLAGLLARPVLRALRRRLDPRRYNGASLLGLRGIVVKSHGSADAIAFQKAIEVGILAAQQEVPQRIEQRLGELLPAQGDSR